MTVSARYRWLVVLVAFAVALGSALNAASHFQINTKTRDFISAKLPWRQNMIAMDKAFPDSVDQIIVVIDAKTPELAEASAQRLTKELVAHTELFRSVIRQNGGSFFNQNALLFLPIGEVQRTTGELIESRPLLAGLAADPSLRGIMDTISGVIKGAARTGALDNFDRPIVALNGALDDVLAGRQPFFSWRQLLTGETQDSRALRQIIEVKPVLDYKALEPGQIPDSFIRKTASELGLVPAEGVQVRLTGPVPLADEEYRSIEEGATLNRAGTVLVVLFILWLAFKSPRLVLAVALSVVAGLAMTAAVGLKLVGAFNLISLAFGILFIGIGTDFAIQFLIRYRAERHAEPDFERALLRTARRIGQPLALAAAATAAGFYSFLPTDYTGVSELGLIAGTGMFIAFFTTLTVLPALLSIMGSPREMRPVGFGFLAPADRFMSRHRYGVVLGTLVLVLACTPLLAKLQFDFDPLNLSPPQAEAVATLRDLMKEPETDPNTITILAPSLADAKAVAERLRSLPEVAQVTTLETFVPENQEPKLAIIHRAARLVKPLLTPGRHTEPPTDAEDVEAMQHAAHTLTEAADHTGGKGVDDVQHLAELIQRLADAPPEVRAIARKALLPGLEMTLDLMRDSLEAKPVSLQSLPADLHRSWETPDGRTLIDVAPTGNPDDNANLIRFSEAVSKIAPNATGQPVIIQESAKTVVKAFVEAGLLALLSISVLLLVVLRRVTDVLLTLVPLALAALVTLEITALTGMKLNFANIIALPLLLGVGVAFKIYYILAWRAGATNLLETSLTRAVVFSAMTTATAFGSLWLSKFPGMSSMGKLLALSLLCTMAAAVLFQPALMGPPRKIVPEEGTETTPRAETGRPF
ncbi:MAG TPA: MMPL family transporter [Methylocella sp.]|nr:MMPL family transporter [Methylocella sp.]